MPTLPARPCTWPTCPNRAVDGGRCAEHAKQDDRQYDRNRPSPSKRGYDRAWQKLRAKFLADNPECAVCGAPAIDVHHIDGDVNNRDEDNLLPLCHRCHSRVTIKQQGWHKAKR